MRAILLILSLVSVALSAPAQQPVGEQFLVSTPPDMLDSRDPAIAVARSGKFTVIWAGTYLDTSAKKCVFARSFNHRGLPTSDRFVVNTSTNFSCRANPRIAMDHWGNSVIVWAGGAQESLLYFQRYNDNGVPVGDETKVSDLRIGASKPLDVAMDLDGRFVVVWDTTVSPGSDTDSYAIIAQRFSVNGEPVGDEFQVNDYTTDAQVQPKVAMDDVGNFVVVWRSTGSPGTDNSTYSVQARIFNFDGPGFAEPQFQVNQLISLDQEDPAVAMGRTGSFVVAWASNVDGGDQGIMARAFAADGTPAGNEYRVDAWPWGQFLQQDAPAVVLTEPGDSYFAWWTHATLTGDDPLDSIAGREFVTGREPSPQFQVNTVIDEYFDDPDIAASAAGGYVVTWWSWEGIHARRYSSPYLIFEDGFESGDIDGWQ